MVAGRQVERRREERNEAEKWSDDERKTILKLGSFFDKWNNRKGKPKEGGHAEEKSFLEELGIKF